MYMYKSFFTLALASVALGLDKDTLSAVTITNVGSVRGNIFLPATAPDGSKITWSSSNPDVISADGVVKRQPEDTDLTLTATAADGSQSFTREFAAKVIKSYTVGEMAGYGFAFFTGNSIEGENIYFASSVGNNALQWQELNDNKPVLRSNFGTKGLRDPFIIRSHEGDVFYLIATDLSIGSGTSWGDSVRTGSRYLEIWESTDLKTWSEQRHVLVSPETAGNTWAPEAFYDENQGAYIVYWASSLYPADDKEHTSSTYHRMMYATTRDFVNFSEAKVWQDAKASLIDSTVIKNGVNFHRFTKDESSTSGCTDIIQTRSNDLLATVDRWTVIDTCIGQKAGAKAVEGPTVFKSNPGDANGDKYYLFIDEYGGRGYIPLETADIEKPEWKVSSGYTLPKSPRHGTVIPLTASELTNLNAVKSVSARSNEAGKLWRA
ncbi:Glycosyl hydrolases family 43 [Ceratocystis lukuohia]|uniref:Endo-1,5-alpha-L-arabinanase A n=3 Tax=Ceratocystis TaxID=5157 RepID=A0A0F8CPI1_CERFI|nr:Glycosyl hydrolases family 43 [Ceratocystis platani]PHH50133.1 hypothetical protein CFIMG_007519RA00001 [Ceratocystis fimbriata CBS 114723]